MVKIPIMKELKDSIIDGLNRTFSFENKRIIKFQLGKSRVFYVNQAFYLSTAEYFLWQ